MKIAASILALGTAVGLVASAAEPDGIGDRAEIAALKTQVEQLRAALPSQSHAMADVEFHFTNLWFAGRYRNWPLATFYFNETRSHIAWTVRLHPVRKLASGQDLELQPLVQNIEQVGFTPLKSALDAHDSKAFETAYRRTLQACHACHVAAEKPFLMPQVPSSPATHLIQLRP